MAKQYTIKQASFWKSIYSFFDGEKQIGQLEQSGVFRQRVNADLDGHHWRIVKSSGLKETTISVLAADTDTTIATYRIRGFRQTGTVELNSTTYRFKVSTWKSHYEWTVKSTADTDDQPIITYNLRGFFRRSGTVEVSDTALAQPDRSLLIVLGLYLGLDVEASNAAAAGATVAVTSVATS